MSVVKHLCANIDEWMANGNIVATETLETPQNQRPHPRPSHTRMPDYRSRTSTHGRNMAGARALWRATGM